MTDRLFTLLGLGYTPETHSGEAITWRRREHNLIADHLVNFTMDAGRSWRQLIPPPVGGLPLRDLNFVCHSDGGARGDRCSASAWTIEAHRFHDGRWSTFPVAMAGTCICPAVSSFTA